MNQKMVIGSVVGLLVVVGGAALYINNLGSTVIATPAAVVQSQPVATQPPAPASSTVPLMQSTGALFSQYKYFSKAHEIFPTLAADTKAALGAFGYTKVALGNNVYRFTLTNSAEGYQGQSVVISGNQSVYFIEPSMGDDSAAEDSITRDDSLVAVDAQGYVLK